MMGGNALKKIGIETVRKTTSEFYNIYNELYPVLSEVCDDIFLCPFYREKETHGDIDILVGGVTVEKLKEFVNYAFKPRGMFINNTTISFDYQDFQVDLNVVENEYWFGTTSYHSYDPLGNLMSKIAKGFGLSYGSFGLYYRQSLKTGVQYHLLTKEVSLIFEVLGFDYEKFKRGFDSLKEIFDYVVSSKYFDKRVFEYENLTGVDRRRSRKRATYRGFLEYVENMKSSYEFNPNKLYYLDYLESYFPGIKNKISSDVDNQDDSLIIKNKFRDVVSKYPSGNKLGKVINDFKKTKNNFEDYLKNTDIEDISQEFDRFYNNYKLNENQKFVDNYETFQMIIKEYDIFDKKLTSDKRYFNKADWSDIYGDEKKDSKTIHIKPYDKNVF